MKNLSNSEKILLSIMIVMIITFGYYKYLLSPVLENKSKIKVNIENYNQQISSLKTIVATNSKMENELKELKNTLSDSIRALPEDERNPEIAQEIKTISINSKVIINSINLGKGITYTPPGTSSTNSSADKKTNSTIKILTVPVSLTISGGYAEILDFISALERNKRLIEITTVNISKGDMVQASISLNYFCSEGIGDSVKK